MIPKSGSRFSEKILRKSKQDIDTEPALAKPDQP
jgi:hypothetical protein